jgi:hypothetical protein
MAELLIYLPVKNSLPSLKNPPLSPSADKTRKVNENILHLATLLDVQFLRSFSTWSPAVLTF